MKIDLDHLHYWMSAIRESSDPIRTLDAFWRGQINSKIWLIDSLSPFVNKEEVTVDICGGWVGVLASLLFQNTKFKCSHIRSIDIDLTCEKIALTMNKPEEMNGRFTALTANMCEVNSNADVIINTSCEHITQEQYELWLSKTKKGSLLVLQSNNYNIPEHIRIAQDLEDFKNQCNISILWEGYLDLPLYRRFMIIGKHV